MLFRGWLLSIAEWSDCLHICQRTWAGSAWIACQLTKRLMVVEGVFLEDTGTMWNLSIRNGDSLIQNPQKTKPKEMGSLWNKGRNQAPPSGFLERLLNFHHWLGLKHEIGFGLGMVWRKTFRMKWKLLLKSFFLILWIDDKYTPNVFLFIHFSPLICYMPWNTGDT